MEEIRSDLLRAEEKERRARAKVQALKRQAFGAARRQDMQRKCALGGVLLAIAARGTDSDRLVVEAVRRYLAESTSNANTSNLAALRGTPFEVDEGATQ